MQTATQERLTVLREAGVVGALHTLDATGEQTHCGRAVAGLARTVPGFGDWECATCANRRRWLRARQGA